MRLRHPVGSYVTMRIGSRPDYALAARMITRRVSKPALIDNE